MRRSLTFLNDYNGTSDASNYYYLGKTIVNWEVTDGCENTNSCSMSVFLINSPLTADATASDYGICEGDNAQLIATPSGGTGNYSYYWTSEIGGFTSYISNPIVYPLQTTTYSLEIYDDIDTAYASVTIFVNPFPLPDFEHYGFCSNQSVYFTDLSLIDSGSVTGWEWDFGNQ